MAEGLGRRLEADLLQLAIEYPLRAVGADLPSPGVGRRQVHHVPGRYAPALAVDDDHAALHVQVVLGRLAGADPVADLVGQRLALLLVETRRGGVEHRDGLEQRVDHVLADGGEHLAVADARVVLEPDRLAGAAPGQRPQLDVAIRHEHLVGHVVGPGLELVLLDVELGLVVADHAQERLGRGFRGQAVVDLVEDVEAVHLGVLQHHLGGHGAGRPHERGGGREQQFPGSEGGAELLGNGCRPVLLAGRVEVMTTGFQRGLDHRPGDLHEGARDVDHDVDVPKQRQQFAHGIGGGDDLGVHRAAVTLLDDFQRGFEPGTRATRKVEGDLARGQRFGNQLARVAAAAVDQNLA